MDTAAFDTSVTDYAARILLRYFSSIGSVNLERPSIALERDRELLRLHWSLSPPISDLVTYVLEHRHEIQSALGSEIRFEDGVVRGRLDAIATLRVRRMSGLATALVSHEPLRSYDSGPNQLLGWVLKEAWSLATRFSSVTFDSPAYKNSLGVALQRLEQTGRLNALAQIMGEANLAKRPTAGALLESARSRRPIYRKAKDAYDALLRIEAGDAATIIGMLRKTLLGPLESWRRFELAVGLSLGEALAQQQKVPLVLNLLVGDTRRQLAEAGRFVIYWQWKTDYFTPAPPEPSEKVTNIIWDAYGMSVGVDRPDLVVVDREANSVAAIAEVKYLTGEDATDRIRSAASQVVRYARGFGPLDESGPLLGRSLIAVSQGLPDGLASMAPASGIPLVAEFEGIKEGCLQQWAAHLSGVTLP